MSADFSRTVRDVGGVHVVALQGELDMATAEGLSDWLVRQSGSIVVVDLAELTFLDSSGITAFVVARNQMTEHGNSMVLTRPSPIVRRALEAVGLEDWIQDWNPDWSSEKVE